MPRHRWEAIELIKRWLQKAFGRPNTTVQPKASGKSQQTPKTEDLSLSNDMSNETPNDSSKASSQAAATSDGASSRDSVDNKPRERGRSQRGGRSQRDRRRGGGSRGGRRGRTESDQLWQHDQVQIPAVEGKTRFLDLAIDDRLVRAVCDMNFEYCSPIQAQILPQTLEGVDAIGKAQTGTGKTAAFLITLINELLKYPIEDKRYLGEPRAVIIAPTRELVTQIAKEAEALCRHAPLNVDVFIGGVNMDRQKQAIADHCLDIVVASPGRLIDFVQQRQVFLDQVEVLVLDEADRLLDMGFIPQVKRIVGYCPGHFYRQTLLFSATFSTDILALAHRWTRDPVMVEIEPESVAQASVEQRIYLVEKKDKWQMLQKILREQGTTRTIVFANRRDQTQRLFERLQRAGFQAGILTGDVPQRKRDRTLEEFKKGSIDILVATDVAGRGIHVDEVSHVINYHLPDDPEDYVHRIGRTGRAGATGISISLACEDESFQLPAIEALLGEKLKCELPPSD